MSDAAGKKGFDKQENDDCRQNLVPPVPDPNYTCCAMARVASTISVRPP